MVAYTFKGGLLWWTHSTTYDLHLPTVPMHLGLEHSISLQTIKIQVQGVVNDIHVQLSATSMAIPRTGGGAVIKKEGSQQIFQRLLKFGSLVLEARHASGALAVPLLLNSVRAKKEAKIGWGCFTPIQASLAAAPRTTGQAGTVHTTSVLIINCKHAVLDCVLA